MIFISYSRRDKAQVIQLRTDLEFRGLSIWLDLDDIPAGTVWAEEIRQGIDNSRYFMLILSSSSVASEYVEREYRYALEQNKPIIPIMIETCAVPTAIEHLQYVDLRNYKVGLSRLLKVFPKDMFNQAILDINAQIYSPNHDIRLAALNIIATRKLSEALPAVLDTLGDPDPEIRAAAAWALAEMRDLHTLPDLIKALYDVSSSVCSNAGWGLVYLGADAVPAVIDVLRNTAHPNAREMAYQVLLRIGGDEANAAIRTYWK
jgi:hypothetical protein